MCWAASSADWKREAQHRPSGESAGAGQALCFRSWALPPATVWSKRRRPAPSVAMGHVTDSDVLLHNRRMPVRTQSRRIVLRTVSLAQYCCGGSHDALTGTATMQAMDSRPTKGNVLWTTHSLRMR